MKLERSYEIKVSRTSQFLNYGVRERGSRSKIVFSPLVSGSKKMVLPLSKKELQEQPGKELQEPSVR